MYSPASRAASRIPEPVADIQFRLYIAFSVCALATTGGTFSTISLSPGTGISIFVTPIHAYSIFAFASPPFKNVLTWGTPQRKTNTDNTSHGTHARNTVVRSCLTTCSIAAAPWSTVPLSASWPFSAVDFQIVFGFQTRRKRVKQAIEMIAAPTSTSHGP